MTNPAHAAVPYSALFEPADSGEWTLPEDALTAKDTHARILGAITNAPAAPPDPYEALVVAALTADDPGSLDVRPLDHQRVTAERDRRLEALRTPSSAPRTTWPKPSATAHTTSSVDAPGRCHAEGGCGVRLGLRR